MTTRIDLTAYLKTGLGRAMLQLQREVHASGLEHSLLELVKTRASILNGCAYCIDMHTKDARAAGESEQRLYGLAAWEETPFYSPRERAALAWTDAVTRVADTHVPDAVYQEVRAHFSEAETVALTSAVAAINAWNRFGVAFRAAVGSYQPAATSPAASTPHAAAVP